MKLLNFTVFRLTIFLILGILSGYFINIELKISVISSFLLLVALTFVYVQGQKKLETNNIFGIIAAMSMLSIGILVVNIHDQRNWNFHYSHIDGAIDDTPKHLHIKVSELLKPSLYQDKYLVELVAIDDQKALGKLLLNIDKDSLNTALDVDDELYINTRLNDIVGPLNPHQFDYGKYLEKKYVYHQIFASNKEILVVPNTKKSIFGFAHQIRKTINTKLNQYDFKPNEIAIINAILLGQKQDLSKDMYSQYSAAGVIHILAVSGLHVGIILLILQQIFRPLNRLRKGRNIKIVLILILLWCFATVAGLSPSVVRAVTMFSIVAIGINLKRPTNIFNTLAISMFILLLIKPMFLFDVGFQLSYLAVFSIVWIQPLIYKKWIPKNKVIDYFWQLFTVTLAAQIGVAPLSIFYFHQFPGLFFISNLVIIPLLGIILGLGILVIVLALLNILPELIVRFYGSIISNLNSFVGWIADQESFLFKSISLSATIMILIYLLIYFGVRVFQERSLKRMMSLLLVILLVQIVFINNRLNESSSFTIMHKSRKSIIAIQEKKVLKIFHDMDSTSIVNDNTIENIIIGENISIVTYDSIRSVFDIEGRTLLIVDSLSAFQVSFNPDIVMLRDSPKVNLERLIDHLQPEIIVADGSNYKSYVSLWEETCKRKKLPFHATAKMGAFTIGLR
ncbi:MAG: ComEC family competence protein [Bacteroidia bacterium]|nr:ComEC family competence protein [Bacteroidia bacterium]MBT8309110.1 ComEC family competence protein [Bacteroidia bacterium]NND11104.1 ComEC family competence protein [Flavobacteriaceae bacterium]NNK28639.1 ComEC family competence protein [Flavobacteriaceae bacterium]